MDRLLLVASGGALGAVCRYGIGLLPSRTAFPIWTLLINLLGALAIGFIAGLTKRGGGWTLFWKTGVCGGFTTFSSFSLEAVRLFEAGRGGLGAAYVVCSVGLCLAGAALGLLLGRYAARG